jgi:prepilin-type N-terminal cleavage/methylation domain-containing protein
MANSCAHLSAVLPRLDAKALTKQKRGFTMTELAIVVAIAGLILAAIWGAYNKVSENYRIGRAMTQIPAIYNAYEKLNLNAIAAGLPTPSYAATDFTCLGLTSGYFTADMVKFPVSSCNAVGDTDFPQSPWYKMYPNSFWGGVSPVSVQISNFVGEPPLLIIWYQGISNEACVALTLAAYNWPGVYEVLAQNLEGTSATGYMTAAYGGSPPDPHQTGIACDGPEGESYVIIYYVVQ